MKINSVRIHNFRSIPEVRLTFSPYTLLVGANNAGKSNVVDAVRCFYGDLTFSKDSDLPKKRKKGFDSESFVEIEFGEVSSESICNEWKNSIKDGKLVVRRTFYDGKDNKACGFEAMVGSGRRCRSVKRLKTIPAGMLGTVHYVPSISKPTEELRLTGPSVLRDLVAGLFGPAFEKTEAFRSFKDAIGRLDDQIHSEKSGLGGLETSLGTEIDAWGAQFKVRLKEVAIADIIRNMLEVQLSDSETKSGMDLSRFGSGFQRNLVFQLVKAGADVSTSGVSESVGPRLLLFEEPEAFLHPDQQQALARSLRKLSESGFQVVCTTHAPCFVGRKMNDVCGIIRLVREKGLTASFQIAPDDWREILNGSTDFPQYLQPFIKSITPQFDLFRYMLWLNGARADLFFAKQVLLVEGSTDAAIIERLCDDGKLNLPAGTVVVDCLGKFNFHRFMALLRALHIKFAVVHDDDRGKTGNDLLEQQEWNKFVKECAELTKPRAKLFPIPGDLETFFGVTKISKRDDVKPYHLLNEYEKGHCKNVETFCKKIESLMQTRRS